MTGADNSTPLIRLAAFRGIIRRGAEGGLLPGDVPSASRKDVCGGLCGGQCAPFGSRVAKSKGRREDPTAEPHRSESYHIAIGK